MTEERNIWLWIRVPLRAIESAIGALKQRSAERHFRKERELADQDDADADELSKGLRGADDPPPEWRWPQRKKDGDK